MSLNPVGTFRPGKAIHVTCIYPFWRVIVRLATVITTQSYKVHHTESTKRGKTHTLRTQWHFAHKHGAVAYHGIYPVTFIIIVHSNIR